MSGSLEGKVVVVTGGTQGLGRGIALHLAGLGPGGVVLCGRNREKGAAAEREVRGAGCPCTYVPADLVHEQDCRQVVRRCDQLFGRLDGLVNAAGSTDRGGLEDTSVALWDRLFAVNVRAPFILMQEAVRVMKREGRGGSIVNVVSRSSHGGQPYLMGYSASKGALATLTRNTAHALRSARIRVNGINLGWTYTDHEQVVQETMGRPKDWLQTADAQQPLGRLLRPHDVAYLAAYLLSDESALMTGSLIDLDQNVMGAYD